MWNLVQVFIIWWNFDSWFYVFILKNAVISSLCNGRKWITLTWENYFNLSCLKRLDHILFVANSSNNKTTFLRLFIFMLMVFKLLTAFWHLISGNFVCCDILNCILSWWTDSANQAYCQETTSCPPQLWKTFILREHLRKKLRENSLGK